VCGPAAVAGIAASGAILNAYQAQQQAHAEQRYENLLYGQRREEALDAFASLQEREYQEREAAAADIQALTSAQVAALTTSQVRSLETTHVAALETTDLAAMSTAQVRAFEAFNRARGEGHSVVAAGSAPPPQLALREDLRTRLGSGLVFQVHPLSDDEKAAALRAQAASRGIALPDEVAAYLLRHLPRSLAMQLAVLDALDRYSLAQKRAVTLPLVREALAALGIR